jgi:hypothetical protein
MGDTNNGNQNTLADRLAQKHEFLRVGDDVPNTEAIILAVATGLGAWGGFPAPPRGFNRFVTNEYVQYALVFVLLMQGGAGKNYKLAGLITGVMYVLHKILDN